MVVLLVGLSVVTYLSPLDKSQCSGIGQRCVGKIVDAVACVQVSNVGVDFAFILVTKIIISSFGVKVSAQHKFVEWCYECLCVAVVCRLK